MVLPGRARRCGFYVQRRGSSPRCAVIPAGGRVLHGSHPSRMTISLGHKMESQRKMAKNIKAWHVIWKSVSRYQMQPGPPARLDSARRARTLHGDGGQVCLQQLLVFRIGDARRRLPGQGDVLLRSLRLRERQGPCHRLVAKGQ